MKRHPFLVALATGWLVVAAGAARAADARNLRLGHRIPDEGYCDQPYVVVLDDGSWLCVLTTGPGREGQKGQHVVSTVSRDQGRTWSPLVDIEPSAGPEASWAVPLKTSFGRVYAFYTYNGDRVHLGRDDTHGWYVYKFTDDGGRTWSQRRVRLPLRRTACDRLVRDGRLVQMFWGIDKPKSEQGRVYFAFTKLGQYFLKDSEGWLFTSDNVLTERDVDKVRWEMRPVGEHGIRNPKFGTVQEEHNLVPLGGERLFCVYRTTLGFPCQTYSQDGGRTWSTPEPMIYTPGGRVVKQPRACPKLWRCSNGRYLFWYHFHSGHGFKGRNPAWVIGGVLRNGRLHWSQPEILLYDPDPNVRTSYPDLIEQNDRYWVTETQKEIARVHEVDPSLFHGLWAQVEDTLPRQVVRRGCVGEWGEQELRAGKASTKARLSVQDGGGFTVELWLTVDRFSQQPLVRCRDEDGRGWELCLAPDRRLVLRASDGRNELSWDTDPGLLTPGRLHHVAFVVDGGPRIITAIVDGVVCDGGEHRQYGWGRFDSAVDQVLDGGKLEASTADARVHRLRLYNRYLRTTEVVQNYRAGMEATCRRVTLPSQ